MTSYTAQQRLTQGATEGDDDGCAKPKVGGDRQAIL